MTYIGLYGWHTIYHFNIKGKHLGRPALCNVLYKLWRMDSGYLFRWSGHTNLAFEPYITRTILDWPVYGLFRLFHQSMQFSKAFAFQVETQHSPSGMIRARRRMIEFILHVLFAKQRLLKRESR